MSERHITCPWCHTQMQVRDESGVEIDQCPNCRGVWLDKGELDAIMDRLATPLPGERRMKEHNSRRDSVLDSFDWF